jgi:hypothetical protein
MMWPPIANEQEYIASIPGFVPLIVSELLYEYKRYIRHVCF